MRKACHFDGGEIALETPHSKSPIFVDIRVRFLLRRNDKIVENGCGIFVTEINNFYKNDKIVINNCKQSCEKPET
jgi:hypothetical protein